MKEKIGGELKSRTFTDKIMQRKYLKQNESFSSPTTALESLIMAFLIDAYEGRHMGVFDIPGAWLQAKIAQKPRNERVLLKIVEDFVDTVF